MASSVEARDDDSSVKELKNHIDELTRRLCAATDEIKELKKVNGASVHGSNAHASQDAANGSSPGGGQDPERMSSALKRKSSSLGISCGSKSGYLFKWQDRSIGWGGTKWGLRFVTLERGRLSYKRSHTDLAARYVLTLRRCAIRDDGQKRNKRHPSKVKDKEPEINETGAYYHVFSIYQRPAAEGGGAPGTDAEDDDDSLIIPLLRFSTPSLAEKEQWMELLSEACAYCDSDAFITDEEEAARRGSTDGAEEERPTRRGTLPPLIFGEPPLPKPKRIPSGTVLLAKARSYRHKAKGRDAAKSNIAAYPPSKPMHRAAGPSYLSDEAPSQNFRGLFNLALLVLVVSNIRLLVDTVRQYGFVLAWLIEGSDLSLSHFADAPLADFPFLTGVVLLQCFIIYCYLIELLLSQGTLNETFGMVLHFINANCALIVPMLITWHFITSPVVGGVLLFHATITWMKLLSYAHANEDYRTHPEWDTHRQTIALIQNLDEKAKDISYPQNVTLRNIYYFWFAPTLTYQIAFPRSRRIRWMKLSGIIFRLVIAIIFYLFLVAQVVQPNLNELVADLEETGDGVFSPHILVDYLLKLSIANTYLWLLMFYIYFHLYLNFFAEILRFGDRVFYKDWWNSSELSAYWRLWNQPVHYWLVRHVYFPCIRMRFSKTAATFTVFFISAIMHEVLISVPFHMVRAWSFMGIMGQVPLVALTKYLDRRWPGSSVGNVIFWMSFCVVGQPMAILLYTIDYWKMTRGEEAAPAAVAAGDSAAGGFWGTVMREITEL